MRVLAAVVGAYGFVWGFAAITTAGLYALGVGFHEAEAAAAIAAFVLYPMVFLWAFVTRSLKVVWAVVVGGALFMVGCAWAIQLNVLV